MDDRLMMETEEEASSVFEGEGEEESQEVMMESQEEEEEEDIIITQEEEEGESEEESEVDEEEAEQLEEMKPPVVTSFMGPDGITVHGIMCIDDGIIRLKNRCQLDDCSICYEPSTAHGKHQICCLPCGHIYGFSCIKKWLLLSSSAGKCPQCNTLCSFQDAIRIYPTRLCVTAHQQASSAAFFPFTEQGSLEFQKYEYSRMCDARLLRLADIKHMNILVTKYNDSACRVKRLATHWVNLLTLADELEDRAECLGLADALPLRACPLGPRVEALRRRAYPLGPRVEALRQRAYALKRLVSALRRRIDALEQRSDAYESRMKFYSQIYDEHHKREEEIAKAEHALESKEKLADKAASKAKNKGEKEAEKVAEKKHQGKEKNGASESEKQKQQREGP